MKVVITQTAKADLQEIGDFIRQDSPKRAVSFIEELLDCCAALADMPLAFPLVPRYEEYNIRRQVYQNYLIFYRANSEIIEVIHIMHGARNYEFLLFG